MTDADAGAIREGMFDARDYIPMMHQKVETSPSLQETLRRMHHVSVYGEDLDGYLSMFSPFPRDAEGFLDRKTMMTKSPDTIPMLERMARGETYLPLVPITGKSFSVLAFYRTMNTFLAQEMEKAGMVHIKNNTGFYLHDDVEVNPLFLEKKTGRILARDRNGLPAKRLVFAIRQFDNGAAIVDFANPNGYYWTAEFSREFLELYRIPELQKLLYRTSRKEKLEQQAIIMEHHPVLSPSALAMRGPQATTDPWTQTALAAPESYASPHKTKLNLDLEATALESDPKLQKEWTEFFGKFANTRYVRVTSFKDLEHNLKELFRNYATVKTNFVPGKGSTLGDRIVMDFTPEETNKETGLMRALEYIRASYADAGMHAPSFMERDVIFGGDGPGFNDYEAICHPRGVTNNESDPVSVGGFPSKIQDILPLFGVRPIQPLRRTEFTLVFTQLLLHARFGESKQDLPLETLAKLRFS